jgi:DNA-binding FadR family transcriptional regulator
MTKRIYRYFIESMKNGVLRPGARVPSERELAMQFGASRATVRKALQVLEEDHLVERRLGSGTFIRHGLSTISSSSSKPVPAVSPLDVLEARLALEPGIIDVVVARATNEDFDRIGAAIERMRSLAAKDDDRDFKEAGYLVQFEIARASRNPLLVRIYEAIVEARVQAGWDTLRKLTDTPERRAEHLEKADRQLAALRARDADTARKVSRGQNVDMITEIIGRIDGGSSEE